jgi:hypothetical protein
LNRWFDQFEQSDLYAKAVSSELFTVPDEQQLFFRFRLNPRRLGYLRQSDDPSPRTGLPQIHPVSQFDLFLVLLDEPGMFPKGANCTPNVGEFRAGLKDPGVPAVCCGTYRLFLLLFALCPVLSRPFPENMRMRNAPRRNPVRPTGFLSYASHCSVGVDSIACQAATGLDDLNPGAFHGITTNL